MEREKGKVVVGMSGGVDSAIAAYLLKEAGFSVAGVTLRTWEAGSSKCCEMDEARKTARAIGIPYHAWNAVPSFEEHVKSSFIKEYLEGRTPNPCVECNRYVKWPRLLQVADVMQADYVATGHYASLVKLENGRYAVKQAADVGKDQSYMLYRLTQEQLSRTILPLGDRRKTEVREIAAGAGLPVAQKKDSQEICFVTEGSYGDYIERELGKASAEGNFVDEEGRVLGRHRGIIHYTVGQRKGLGIALGSPAYVKRIDPGKNEVVLGADSALYSREMVCGDLALMGKGSWEDGEKLRALVKIRYQHRGTEALLERRGERVHILFDAPVRAATPGQSAVFYDEERCVLGGGKIFGIE